MFERDYIRRLEEFLETISIKTGCICDLDDVESMYNYIDQLQNTIHNIDYTKCSELLNKCYIEMCRNAVGFELCEEIEKHFA